MKVLGLDVDRPVGMSVPRKVTTPRERAAMALQKAMARSANRLARGTEVSLRSDPKRKIIGRIFSPPTFRNPLVLVELHSGVKKPFAARDLDPHNAPQEA